MLTAVRSGVRSAPCQSALTHSVFPLSRKRRGPVVNYSMFGGVCQSSHTLSSTEILWVCLCGMFVQLYRSTYDSVELSLGGCVAHFYVVRGQSVCPISVYRSIMLAVMVQWFVHTCRHTEISFLFFLDINFGNCT